jgi:hypothetical protein
MNAATDNAATRFLITRARARRALSRARATAF